MNITTRITLVSVARALVFPLVPLLMHVSCGQHETAPATPPVSAESGSQETAGHKSPASEEPGPFPNGDRFTLFDAGPFTGGAVTVIAYYFHGTIRCVECLLIEEKAREAIFEVYVPLMEEGDLEWRSVNYEVPEYQHYVSKYNLSYPSLVLVRQRAGFPEKHKLLEETWELSADPAALKEFVIGETGDFVADSMQSM